MGAVTARRRVQYVTAAHAVARSETLVVEEPLEIRVNGNPITVTMRTPDSDIELAQGHMVTWAYWCADCTADAATLRW